MGFGSKEVWASGQGGEGCVLVRNKFTCWISTYINLFAVIVPGNIMAMGASN